MRRAVLVLALMIAASPAWAQKPKPLPAWTFDVHGFSSKLAQDPTTAQDLDVAAGELPSRGFGGVAGIVVYPVRGRNVALGFGAEGILARAGRTPDLVIEEHDAGPVTTALPTVEQRLRGFSGSFSLNFGHRDGWSYLSAGMGPLSFVSFPGTIVPAEPPPTQMTLNLGAGARWFIKRHLAFSFDVRIYQTNPEVLTPTYPRRQRTNILILSAGISLR
jgi:hypothetical protein